MGKEHENSDIPRLGDCVTIIAEGGMRGTYLYDRILHGKKRRQPWHINVVVVSR